MFLFMNQAFSKKRTLFKGGHYSKEDNIYGNTVYKKILKTVSLNSRSHHKKILPDHSILNSTVPDKRQSVLLHLYCPENKERVL